MTFKWSFDNALKLIPFQEFANAPGSNKTQRRTLQGKPAAKGGKPAIINPPFKGK